MEMFLPGQPSSYRQWCLVYDDRDGRVVHIHEFFALDADNACRADELEQQALSHVVHCEDPAHLKVLHPPAGVQPDPFAVYRVKPKDGTLQIAPMSKLEGEMHKHSGVLQRRALMPEE